MERIIDWSIWIKALINTYPPLVRGVAPAVLQNVIIRPIASILFFKIAANIAQLFLISKVSRLFRTFAEALRLDVFGRCWIFSKQFSFCSKLWTASYPSNMENLTFQRKTLNVRNSMCGRWHDEPPAAGYLRQSMREQPAAENRWLPRISSVR